MTSFVPMPSVELVVGPRYHPETVAVDGGELFCGVWEPDPPQVEGSAPTVVLVHGITSSHLAWPALVDLLPAVRVLAPDLRGRAASRDLPGPYGMGRHADDVAAAIRALHPGDDPVTVVGHSMGGFVGVVLADRHPGLVGELVLVDGGLPLTPPPGVSPDQLAEATLGPAAARLRQTFSTRADYRDYWRQHPALGRDWSELSEAYADYDLVGEEPALHPATREAALHGDIRELVDGHDLLRGLDRLRHPTTWLVAPRGLMDEVPPLYPEQARAAWCTAYPSLVLAEIPDVNHYSIVLSRHGAAEVAPWVEQAVARQRGDGHGPSRG
ncbi:MULTISPECIES: alpha/beta fold hydrolase [unclassified Ornithinimicrobium]|uniref:alpha/beta fold hydrolase n=1 Tax=unclassified Ornithinimicrobium TaxID=2615080 RepID=UPI0038544E92